MSLRTRKNLFFFLLLVFIVIAPLTIFGSQGYRFDFQKWHLTRVGAIVIKTNLSDATVKVGERTVELRASLLYSGTLLRNLLPRTYELVIDGGRNYFNWKKKIVVEPLSVAKVTHVLLVPKNPEPRLVTVDAPLAALWFSNGRNSILAFNTNLKHLYEISLRSNAAANVFGPDIQAFNARPGRIESSAGGQNLLFAYQKDFLLYVPEKKLGTELLGHYLARMFVPQSPPQVVAAQWHPTNSAILFLTTNQGLYQVDVVKNRYARITRELLRGIGGTERAYYIASNTIWEIGSDGRSEAALSFAATLPPSGLEISELPNGDFLMHKPDDTLAIISREAPFETLGNRVRFPLLSPDKLKLVFIDGNKLILRPLQVDLGDILLANLMSQTLKTFDMSPRALFWLKTSWHVLAVFDNHVEIVEIDPRSPVNFADVSLGVIKTFVFDSKSNIFYWTDDAGVLKSWTIQ